MLDYALAYARQNLRVFPLHSVHSGDCSCGRDTCSSVGKHPRTKNGVKDATLDAEQIQQWWAHWPEANIGIATGNGLYVIDVDCAKGGSYESLASLGIASLTWTLTSRTGNGGYHFYLHCAEPLGNTAGKLGPAIDTRGEGGYVVAPPGQNRYGRYSWHTRAAIQMLPTGVLARLKEHRPSGNEALTLHVVPQSEQENHYYAGIQTTTQNAPSALSPATDATTGASQLTSSTLVPPASVVQEARNNYLVSMAGHLRGHGLCSQEIRALLITLNQTRYGDGRHPQGPLPLSELENTIFKSVEKWEQECGVLTAKLPAVGQLTNLMQSALPEPNWLVPDLLCEGLVLLAGKPKLGKSWLALSLALTCALGTTSQGGRVLGRYPVRSAGVLYLSLEDSANRFQSRVSKLLNGRPVPEKFGYALDWRPLAAGGLVNLDTTLTRMPDTRLVVIDTLARVRAPSASSGNVYQEDYTLMAMLHEMVIRHHITLILVHHTRKMGSTDTFDEISGSTGLTGAADTSIVLKRERGQAEATLHLTGRDIEEQELALTFNPTTCSWTCSGNASERQVNQSRQEILDMLEQNEPMTPMEMAKALKKPYGTIKQYMYRMRKDGILVTRQQGRYALAAEGAAAELFPEQSTTAEVFPTKEGCNG